MSYNYIGEYQTLENIGLDWITPMYILKSRCHCLHTVPKQIEYHFHEICYSTNTDCKTTCILLLIRTL